MPGHPLYPSDQLEPLYSTGLHNLWEVLAAEAPAGAYSFVFEFDGQAQTLDHLFVNHALMADLVTVRAAHVNADYPAGVAGSNRGVSNHDPQVARFLSWPTLTQLAQLVQYLADRGDVDAKAEDRLMALLDRAQLFLDRGNQSAYKEQLESFINQVESRTPSQITQSAAAALIQEAQFLLGQI